MGSYAGHRLQVVMPNDAYEHFKAIAKAQHRPMGNLAAAILVDWLKTQPKPETLKEED